MSKNQQPKQFTVLHPNPHAAATTALAGCLPHAGSGGLPPAQGSVGQQRRRQRARLTRVVMSGNSAAMRRWMSAGRASTAPPTWDTADRKPSCMLQNVGVKVRVDWAGSQTAGR